MEFVNLCEIGNLDEIKKFLNKNPNFDIHYFNEFAFQTACKNNQLKVVKWLIDTYDDINYHACNELAFRWACHNGHLEVAFFLKKKFPETFISLCEMKSWKANFVKQSSTKFPDIDHHASNDYCYKFTKNSEILEWLHCECKFPNTTKSARKKID